MERLQIFSNSSVEWTPSPVVALATSDDGSQVAAAREDGSVEIWLVSPGSVGWHCQLTIRGNPNSRVSSMVWISYCSKSGGRGRLLSSSIDGSISEWDFFSLQQKIVLDSIGVSIWQMALEPIGDSLHFVGKELGVLPNGNTYDDEDSNSESITSDGDDDPTELNDAVVGNKKPHLALACDDGCVRLYTVEEGDLAYKRSFPRVSGRTLSVAWSLDAKLLFSGSSDGIIRCWNTTSFNEAYRITVGLGGLGSGSELCVWTLLFLRCGTLVSGDSIGSVQFWDSRHGTLLQNHTYHKGDVNALAAAPSHNRLFSAGSDGQVILYKRSSNAADLAKVEHLADRSHNWIYVGYVRVHTHDVRALTVAVPISLEVSFPNDKSSGKVRHRKRSINFTYHKWAHLGVPMLISGGDDTKLFAYSAREFTQYSPHDICPAPQRVLVQMVRCPAFDGASLLLAQHDSQLDVLLIKSNHPSMPSVLRRKATTQVIAHVKSKESRKIISSTISNTGSLFAYSDHVKPCIFELKQPKPKKSGWSVKKLQLSQRLPYAHCMVFNVDSSRLMLAGHDRKIYVLDVKSLELVHTFLPQGKEGRMSSVPCEPPITRMFNSSDGQWLASVNCFGDIYVFNLETYRQHWFISRLDGASVTAGGFLPSNSNALVITTSSNQIYVFDVEAKQLGEWSRRHKNILPRRFQDFPGEVIGLSFPPSHSTLVMIYSSRAMCLVDFGMPIHQDDELNVSQDQLLDKQVISNNSVKANRKRKKIDQAMNLHKKMNFEFCAFKDPVLFVGHLSENSVFLLEKPWLDVVKNFDAPVHRHIYGT